MGTLSLGDRTRLWRFLQDRFSMSELDDLCFELGVSYELLPHHTKAEFARKLVEYFEARSKLGSLVTKVRELRPDPDNYLAELLAQLLPATPRKKVQIIIPDDIKHRIPQLLRELAKVLGLDEDEIWVVAATAGSVRLLISLPAEAADRLLVSGVHILDGSPYQLLSLTSFDRLDPASQKAWRRIYDHHPPVRQGGTLRPTISWPRAPGPGRGVLTLLFLAITVLVVGLAAYLMIRSFRGPETVLPPPTVQERATRMTPTPTPRSKATVAPTPTTSPTSLPTLTPTHTPTATPTKAPTFTPTYTPTPTKAPTFTPTHTFTPTKAPTSTPTPEPRCKVVATAAMALNMRSGPGTVYAPIAVLPHGTDLEPLAYQAVGFPEGQWIQVRVLTFGHVGWVRYGPELVDCTMDPADLPPGSVPPTPTVEPAQRPLSPRPLTGTQPSTPTPAPLGPLAIPMPMPQVGSTVAGPIVK